MTVHNSEGLGLEPHFEMRLRTDVAGVFSHDIANLAHLVNETVQAIANYASSTTDWEEFPQNTGGQHFTMADFRRLLEENDILGIDAFEYLRAQISSFINDDEFDKLKNAIYNLEFSAALIIMQGRLNASAKQYHEHDSETNAEWESHNEEYFYRPNNINGYHQVDDSVDLAIARQR